MLVVACAAALVPALVLAQGAKPRSLEDCEKIEEAMNYNACLASFGPKRGERPSAGSGVERAQDEEPAARRGTKRRTAGQAKPAGRSIPGAIDYGQTRDGKRFVIFGNERR